MVRAVTRWFLLWPVANTYLCWQHKPSSIKERHSSLFMAIFSISLLVCPMSFGSFLCVSLCHVFRGLPFRLFLGEFHEGVLYTSEGVWPLQITFRFCAGICWWRSVSVLVSSASVRPTHIKRFKDTVSSNILLRARASDLNDKQYGYITLF